MKVILSYETQLKRAVGVATETLEVPDGANVDDVVRAVARRHDEQVAGMLLDAAGDVRTSVLMFVGDQQIGRDAPSVLSEGDTLTLMSPISGG